jgi:Tol biopolymer transport system component
MQRRLLVVAVAAAWLAPAAHAAPRIVYASDWNGPTQIFLSDPSGRAPVRQVTFARPAPCRWAAACGFTRPRPSPDGRWLAYWTGGANFEPSSLWLARANGTNARPLGVAADATWSPDSRRFAYTTANGIHVRTMTGRDRIVDRHAAGRLRFSPDGKALAFMGGGLMVLRGGHVRTLARSAQASLAWSPDGRRIAYGTESVIAIVDVATGRSHVVYRARSTTEKFGLVRLELAWSPTGRWLAFMLGNVRVLDVRTLHVRPLTQEGGRDLAWSPDGRSILYAQSVEGFNGDEISTGDVRTVTLTGHTRTVVSAAKPYGGQIVAAAWTRKALGVRYRPPQQVDGVFAGGPVQELVADGPRVGFIACARVFVWTPSSDELVAVSRLLGPCQASFSRGHVYSLAVAGDRVAWWEKGWGLCFMWTAREATVGAPAVELGSGTGCLGSAPVVGTGTALGADSLLVRSAWRRRSTGNGMVTDEQTIERIEPGGCPCPALSSSPGPYTPLDVNAGRIVVSGENETRILDANGATLLSLPVSTAAAELSGTELAVAASDGLRVYDAQTGVLRSTWPLAATAVHACDLYGDPSCVQPARLTFEDLARGRALYVLDGEVHVLRLVDGADTVVAPGTAARFADAGLVYADGARVRLTPWERVPLRND